jgi:predicted FMN-binding regulatory protein PaiB
MEKRKVEKIKNPAVFWRRPETYRLNMAISEFISSKSGNFLGVSCQIFVLVGKCQNSQNRLKPMYNSVGKGLQRHDRDLLQVSFCAIWVFFPCFLPRK